MSRSVSKSLSASLALNGLVGSDHGIEMAAANSKDTDRAIAIRLRSTGIGMQRRGGFVLAFNAGSTQVGLLLRGAGKQRRVRFPAEPKPSWRCRAQRRLSSRGRISCPRGADRDQLFVRINPSALR